MLYIIVAAVLAAAAYLRGWVTVNVDKVKADFANVVAGAVAVKDVAVKVFNFFKSIVSR